jgi:hypothetical protein
VGACGSGSRPLKAKKLYNISKSARVGFYQRGIEDFHSQISDVDRKGLKIFGLGKAGI